MKKFNYSKLLCEFNQNVDLKTISYQNALKEITDLYFQQPDVLSESPATIADRLLLLSIQVVDTHNFCLTKDQRYLRWKIPKRLEPFQMAVCISKINTIDLQTIGDNELNRLIFECDPGYSRPLTKVRKHLELLLGQND